MGQSTKQKERHTPSKLLLAIKQSWEIERLCRMIRFYVTNTCSFCWILRPLALCTKHQIFTLGRITVFSPLCYDEIAVSGTWFVVWYFQHGHVIEVFPSVCGKAGPQAKAGQGWLKNFPLSEPNEVILFILFPAKFCCQVTSPFSQILMAEEERPDCIFNSHAIIKTWRFNLLLQPVSQRNLSNSHIGKAPQDLVKGFSWAQAVWSRNTRRPYPFGHSSSGSVLFSTQNRTHGVFSEKLMFRKPVFLPAETTPSPTETLGTLMLFVAGNIKFMVKQRRKAQRNPFCFPTTINHMKNQRR